MSLEGLPRKLLEELTYQRGFPPRASATQIKSELAVRGLGNSGALVEKISGVYLEVIERVLDDFADRVLKSGDTIGLTDDAEMRGSIADAHQELFDLARGLVLDELTGTNYGPLATAMIDARREDVRKHLDRKIALRVVEQPQAGPRKEFEQKFGILLSPTQAEPDFEAYAEAAKAAENPIALLFIDIDHFREFNARFTNAKVDETILPEAQRLLAKLVQGRGEGYRHGGEEFLLIVPNLDVDEAGAFAEKVRRAFADHEFSVDRECLEITVSVGVAVWPVHGSTYKDVLELANRAEVNAKQARNAVVIAGGD